jgi:hypothetical protein
MMAHTPPQMAIGAPSWRYVRAQRGCFRYMKFNEAMALTENPVDKLAGELGVEVSTTGRLGQVSAETMAPKPVPAAEMER